ncbi:MAG TPA: VOC family protein [Kofleriaceae bacterium]|nr:VOC family protein [Kofleriaceae bacterium]
MKPTPRGWPRLSVAVFYQDANAAIEWLCKAFGFEVRLKVDGDGGVVEHSELTYGDALVMVGDQRRQTEKGRGMISPRSIDGRVTASLMLYVDDVAAHCERARAAGAVITDEPSVHDYGEEYWADRSYGCKDLDGHHWWFCERVRGA